MKRRSNNNPALEKKVISMRGEPIDLHAFLQTHGHKPAISNANLNARGDKIGRQGQVIQTAEDMRKEYNKKNPKSVSKQVSLKNIQQEVFSSAVSPAEAVKHAMNTPDVPPNVPAALKKRKLVDPDS